MSEPHENYENEHGDWDWSEPESKEQPKKSNKSSPLWQYYSLVAKQKLAEQYEHEQYMAEQRHLAQARSLQRYSEWKNQTAEEQEEIQRQQRQLELQELREREMDRIGREKNDSERSKIIKMLKKNRDEDRK